MNVRNEQGLVGKVLVVWLIILAAFALAVMDFASITVTRFHIADIAATAAQDGADAYLSAGAQAGEKSACDAARSSLHTADPAIKLTKCSYNVDTKELTITVRKIAGTIAAKHIGFFEKFANVEDTETAGPSTL